MSESQGREGQWKTKTASRLHGGRQDRVVCAPHLSLSRIHAALSLFLLVKLSFADSLFTLCQPAEFQSLAREAQGLTVKENLRERGTAPSLGRQQWG